LKDSNPSALRAIEAIVLAPYNAEWTEAFARESSVIAAALPGVAIALHHIGSTAVPGLLAKPVIDMLGVLPAVEAMDEQVGHLAALGYEALGEYGIAGRRYFRKDSRDGVRTHQLHCYSLGATEMQRHLDFRDYLRAFPAEAAAYAALKQRLAERHAGDMRAYSDGKTAFVRAVEAKAAAWRRAPR
jgi:GrpB-like predicted nucleotidyltransferase (UPF0157 family)